MALAGSKATCMLLASSKLLTESVIWPLMLSMMTNPAVEYHQKRPFVS